MAEKKRTDAKKIVRFLTYFYLVILGAMLIFNTVNSMLRTTYFNLYLDMEAARYKWDNPVFMILYAAAVFGLLYCVRDRLVRWKFFDGAALAFCALLCIAIVFTVRAKAICDGETVSQIAAAFIQGDYGELNPGGYLFSYSYQIGIVAFLEVLWRLAGACNDRVFQLISTGCIVVLLWTLNRITKEIFEEEKIRKTESLLSMGMLPLFLTATFVYGDVIGWTLGTLGVYCVIRFMKSERWRYLCGACILFAAGVTVKTNIAIMVAAAVISLTLYAFYRKKYIVIPIAIAMGIFSRLGGGLLGAVYADRAGLEEFPSGVPMIAWVAMGFQETDEGGYPCGWYNAYNWNVYAWNGYDEEATARECLADLQSSLGRLVHEQRYALNYIYKKFTSQWNEPTFLTMLSNEWGMRHTENDSALAHYFIFGTGRTILCELMNGYHFVVFLLAAAFFILKRKEWSLPAAYFMLNIFGGFLFHMIWEAKSRYVLIYFVMLLPLAAAGCSALIDLAKKRAARRKDDGR